ncbi:helix-turn-helix transcriptional regulator (plasmid) [Rhizobium sp. CB3060]|uniref:helix-turn-helix domain-containing protein n=1 Tax=Rhizobium sp. CB3060 TaxID=3138255 RepID=UPI0021A5E2A8|nr:helix-turn-helix transcriptional regulator [Rhizobium tropici]UWU25700.1 helix-turn-helix transcriptional regulator [Rhizobium tropici]
MTIWKLSPIERSCLRWISLGWSVSEIALLEGKSEAEIRSHLNRALVRLGATSLREALAKLDCPS